MTLGMYREGQLKALSVKPQLGDVRIVYYRGEYRVEVWCWRFLWLGRHWCKICSHDDYNIVLAEAKKQMEIHNKKLKVLWFNGVGNEDD